MENRTSRQLSTELREAERYIDFLLGNIEISDPDVNHIRYFEDPYSEFGNDREFRWRIYTPTPAQCQFRIATGNLPKNGFPDTEPYYSFDVEANSPGEYVLIVGFKETFPPDKAGSYHFGIQWEGVSTGSDYSGEFEKNADWIPWFQRRKTITEEPSKTKTTTFTLDEPFVIMKHYVVNDDESLTGYMIWVEEKSTTLSNADE